MQSENLISYSDTQHKGTEVLSPYPPPGFRCRRFFLLKFTHKTRLIKVLPPYLPTLLGLCCKLNSEKKMDNEGIDIQRYPLSPDQNFHAHLGISIFKTCQSYLMSLPIFFQKQWYEHAIKIIYKFWHNIIFLTNLLILIMKLQTNLNCSTRCSSCHTSLVYNSRDLQIIVDKNC